MHSQATTEPMTTKVRLTRPRTGPGPEAVAPQNGPASGNGAGAYSTQMGLGGRGREGEVHLLCLVNSEQRSDSSVGMGSCQKALAVQLSHSWSE